MKTDPASHSQAKPSGTPQPEALRSLLPRTLDALRMSIARLLRVDDEGKPGIYAKVFASTELNDLNYWLEILFSIGIATLGLITNSPAVVIGAMLISPLMGPIIASGLALALGDFYLGLKSFVTLSISIVVSIGTAALVTWVLPFHSPTGEILARVQPTLLDLGIAILSGAAGAVVVCRGGAGGGVTALPGVAVAVALMPPLGVVGFGVGVGWDGEIVRGGGLLFLTNLVAIIFTSFVVFFAVRMDAPEVRQQINQWLYERERGERLYTLVERTPLRALLGKVGTLPRRMLILLIFLVSVAFPLGRTLVQLTENARVRRIVQAESDRAIPRDAVVRQDLDINPDLVRLRLVAVMPEGFPAAQREALQQRITDLTGRPTKVVVYDVPTSDEVAALSNRFSRQGSSEPLLAGVDQLRAQLLARVRAAVESAWPAAAAPLAGYSVGLEPESDALTVHLAYLADAERELGEIGAEAVRTALRDRLGGHPVELQLERLPAGTALRFARGAAQLSAADRTALLELAAVMQRFPRLRLQVNLPGSAGQPPDALTTRRLQQIRVALAEQQVSADRIETRPAASAEQAFLIRLTVAALN
jgi:uncharacterized hydrophobic protein (TIGR00271 family)